MIARAGHDPVAGAGVLVALTAVAVADVVLVVLSRRLARRPLLRGGSDHLAHRLRRLGLTAQGVTVLVAVAAFAAVLVGVLVHAGWVDARAVLWVAGGALVVVLGMLRVAVYGPPRARGRRDRRARRARTAGAARGRAVPVMAPVAVFGRRGSRAVPRPAPSSVPGRVRRRCTRPGVNPRTRRTTRNPV